ncbi:class I SAM-dependent methyltransferase [Denitratimonas sp. CY0512]|uniref:class I SAM-dependent methyltransferase n=1 Tax=Denitratimonas sp. CY0512 TaxID=3131940 RepID=UPI0030AFD048
MSGMGGTCRVCGSALLEWRRPWLSFKWGRCGICCSVQKIISELEYWNLNPSYDPGYQSGNTDLSDLLVRMDVDGKEKLLRKFFPEVRAGGRLLDIGCGMGGFLLAGMRAGLKVRGVEPSASHSKAATELFDLDVVSGYYKKGMFEEKFDIVILSHVIEHIYQPGEFLECVVDALAPGGRLLVITPNAQALTAKLCGRYWSMYKPIDHVTMIGSSAVEYLVPNGTSLELIRTNEWSGEFAAHLISAIRTFLRPEVANVESTGHASSTKQSTLSSTLRIALAVFSLPFKWVGRLTGRQSCLYFVLKKEGK